MNSTLEALATANENTLKFVTTVHERVLAAFREFQSQPAPEVPAALAQFLPQPSSEATAAFSQLFPQPEPEVIRGFVDETANFATKLVEANRAFALGLLGVSQPTVSTVSPVAAAAAPIATPKPTKK